MTTYYMNGPCLKGHLPFKLKRY